MKYYDNRARGNRPITMPARDGTRALHFQACSQSSLVSGRVALVAMTTSIAQPSVPPTITNVSNTCSPYSVDAFTVAVICYAVLGSTSTKCDEQASVDSSVVVGPVT
jgi:hypothetical protein